MRKQILLLGASGSIGTQTLQIIKKRQNNYVLTGFSVGNRTRCINNIIKNNPQVEHICVKEKQACIRYQKQHPHIHFYFGDDGLKQIIHACEYEMMVNALVGFVGLVPTIEALKLNKTVALANKESLVVGGEIINKLLSQGKGKIYPIDSEHVALSKCLKVENTNVDKLVITASGGAFRNLTRDQLEFVTAQDALKHPTWKMGNKITIDSATMVNKTFEIIEAYYLFGYSYKDISLLLHSESNVHSLILYKDGTYRADKSKPDMRIPIEYAISENLIPFKTYKVNDYHQFKNQSFAPFDYQRFPVVNWAKVVIDQKGTYGAVLNAANEEAVYAFLAGKIKFLDIEKIINKFMKENDNIINASLEDLIITDNLIRTKVKDYIRRNS